jgi:hypothetical protein
MQLEYFDNPLPNRLALENLFHGHALPVGGFNPVQFANHVFQFFDVGHGRPSNPEEETFKGLLSELPLF